MSLYNLQINRESNAAYESVPGKESESEVKVLVSTTSEPEPLPSNDIPTKTMWFFLILIYLAMIGDMIASSLTGPFAPKWLIDQEGLDLPKSWQGFYSGLLTGLYPFANSLSAPLLGYWSDKNGRKPVLVGSLISASVFTFSMLATRNAGIAFTSRALAGFCDGSQGITYAMIGDITKGRPKDRTMAFAYAMAAFQVARVGSSSIGGYLVNQVNFSLDGTPNYYLFPAFLASAFLILVALTIQVCLKETSETAKQHLQNKAEAENQNNQTKLQVYANPNLTDERREPLMDSTRPSATSDATPVVPVEQQSFRDRFLAVWRHGLLVRVIFVYSIVNGCNGAFLVLVPLQCEVTGDLGYNMSTGDVGLILSVFAAWAFLFQLTIFKPLVAKLGLVRANNLGTVLMGVSTILFPISAYVQAIPYQATVAISMTVAGSGYMLCSSLLTTMSSNLTPQSLHGTVQGWSRAVANVFRGVGPFAAGALWSASDNYPISAFAVVAAGYLLCFFLMFRVPNHAVDKAH